MAKAGIQIQADLQKLRAEVATATKELRQFNQDALNAATGVRSLEAEGRRASSTFGGFFKQFTAASIVTNALTRIKDGVINFSKSAVKASSDLTELTSKAQVLFGQAFPQVQSRTAAIAKEVGRASSAILQFSTDMAAVFDGMGIGKKRMTDMSTTLSKLAVDLASFFNTSDQQAFDALQSGLTGMERPMRQFGVVLTEANLKEYALAKGIKEHVDKMTQAQLVQLRYNYILDHTKSSQGDAARTADTFANQSRRLEGNIRTLQEEIGRNVTAVMADSLKEVNSALESTQDGVVGASKAIGTVFAAAVKDAAEVLKFFTGGLGQMITVAGVGAAASLALARAGNAIAGAYRSAAAAIAAYRAASGGAGLAGAAIPAAGGVALVGGAAAAGAYGIYKANEMAAQGRAEAQAHIQGSYDDLSAKGLQYLEASKGLKGQEAAAARLKGDVYLRSAEAQGLILQHKRVTEELAKYERTVLGDPGGKADAMKKQLTDIEGQIQQANDRARRSSDKLATLGGSKLMARVNAAAGITTASGGNEDDTGFGGGTGDGKKGKTAEELAKDLLKQEEKIASALGDQAKANKDRIDTLREELEKKRDIGTITRTEETLLERINNRVDYQKEAVKDATDAWEKQKDKVKDLQDEVQKLNDDLVDANKELAKSLKKIDQRTAQKRQDKVSDMTKRKQELESMVSDSAGSYHWTDEQSKEYADILKQSNGATPTEVTTGQAEAGMTDLQKIDAEGEKERQEVKQDYAEKANDITAKIASASERLATEQDRLKESVKKVTDAIATQAADNQTNYKVVEKATRDHVAAEIAEWQKLQAELAKTAIAYGNARMPAVSTATATKKASGGYIAGPGGPRDDLIPAMLSNGEFVVNARATRMHLGLLTKLNSGLLRPQAFASGGIVNNNSNTKNANVTIHNHGDAARVATDPRIVAFTLRRHA